MQARTSRIAGVGDHRRARVGDQHHPRAALDLLRELARALGSRCPRGWRRGAGAGSRAARRAARRGACPRRRRGRPPRAPAWRAALMSSRLPIGVGQTVSRPAISRASHASSSAIVAAPIMPASGPSSAAQHRRLVHRRQRARPQLARAPARRAARRPPRRRRRSRSRRARRCWRGSRARPRAGGRSRRRPRSRSRRPPIAASVTSAPVDLLAGGQRHAERRVGVRARRRAGPRGRARCPTRAPRRSRGSGSCPGTAGRRRR